jgi:predicted acetyltransferase
VLELNKYPDTAGSVRVKIYGDFITENNGIYDISFEKGKGTVRKELDGEYDIAITIQSFSRLVFGDVHEYAIPFLDGIEIKNNDKIAVLSRCFAKKPLNLFERF